MNELSIKGSESQVMEPIVDFKLGKDEDTETKKVSVSDAVEDLIILSDVEEDVIQDDDEKESMYEESSDDFFNALEDKEDNEVVNKSLRSINTSFEAIEDIIGSITADIDDQVGNTAVPIKESGYMVEFTSAKSKLFNDKEEVRIQKEGIAKERANFESEKITIAKLQEKLEKEMTTATALKEKLAKQEIDKQAELAVLEKHRTELDSERESFKSEKEQFREMIETTRSKEESLKISKELFKSEQEQFKSTKLGLLEQQAQLAKDKEEFTTSYKEFKQEKASLILRQDAVEKQNIAFELKMKELSVREEALKKDKEAAIIAVQISELLKGAKESAEKADQIATDPSLISKDLSARVKEGFEGLVNSVEA